MKASIHSTPDEVLHKIIELVQPTTDPDRHDTKNWLTFGQVELPNAAKVGAMSLVDSRFRRLCLPILFDVVECWAYQDGEHNVDSLDLVKLRNGLLARPHIARLIQHVQLKSAWDFSLQDNPRSFQTVSTAVVHSVLPLMPSLLTLDISKRVVISAVLACTINEHSSLRQVFFTEIDCLERLPLFEGLSIAKLHLLSVIIRQRADYERLRVYCQSGLHVFNVSLLCELNLGEVAIPGLTGITLSGDGGGGPGGGMDLRLLPRLVLHHDQLSRITVTDRGGIGRADACGVACVDEIVHALREDGLLNAIALTRIDLSPSSSVRLPSPGRPGSSSLDEWVLSTIDLEVHASTIRGLRCVGGLGLTTQVKSLGLKIVYTSLNLTSFLVEDFISCLCTNFPSLELLTSANVFPSIDFGAIVPPPWDPDGIGAGAGSLSDSDSGVPTRAQADTGFRWLVMNLARRLRALDSVMVEEMGRQARLSFYSSIEPWYLRGWYDVRRQPGDYDDDASEAEVVPNFMDPYDTTM